MTLKTTILLVFLLLVGTHGFARADVVLTSDRPGHVFSTEEDAVLTVSGATDGTLLTLRWLNSAGQTLAQTSRQVTASSINLGKIPAGWFRIIAHREGDLKDPAIDIASARPRSTTPFDDSSPFGLTGLPLTDADWDLFAQMGGKWVQWSLPWSYAEQLPGKYWHMIGDPYRYDYYVQQATNRGIRTVLQFRETPTWASAGTIGSYLGTEPRTRYYPPDDDHWGDFENFEAEAINHFGAMGVKHFENWSEATGSMFRGDYSPNYPKLEAYQRMLLHLRHTIDSRQLDARIVADGGITAGRALKFVEQGYFEPSTYRDPLGAILASPYYGKTLAGMGDQVVDIVSGHFYWVNWQTRRFFAPEEPNDYPVYRGKTLSEAVTTTRLWAGTRPIWNTEWGYGSADSAETVAPMFVSEDQQANYLVRFYILASAAGLEKNFYYRWRDYMSGTRLATSYGLLRVDGVVKPSYIAYRTMTERLQGLRFDTLMEKGPTYWTVQYKGTRTVIAAWKVTDGQATHEVAVPWDTVRVTGRDGDERLVQRKNGTVSITLTGGAPVFLDACPAPRLTSLTPSSTSVGVPITVTARGTYFAPNAVLRWNGVDHLTSVVSSTELRAQLSAEDVAVAGSFGMTVVNPGATGKKSNSRTFTVTAPP